MGGAGWDGCRSLSPLLVEGRSQQTEALLPFARHRAKTEGKRSGVWLPLAPRLLISWSKGQLPCAGCLARTALITAFLVGRHQDVQGKLMI